MKVQKTFQVFFGVCVFLLSVVGNFFGYSCVPGIKDPQHDPRGNNPKNLCEACIGDENDRHICANNHRERHYGESGALRYTDISNMGNNTTTAPRGEVDVMTAAFVSALNLYPFQHAASIKKVIVEL